MQDLGFARHQGPCDQALQRMQVSPRAPERGRKARGDARRRGAMDHEPCGHDLVGVRLGHQRQDPQHRGSQHALPGKTPG